jgi:hypothetical protein
LCESHSSALAAKVGQADRSTKHNNVIWQRRMRKDYPDFFADGEISFRVIPVWPQTSSI